MQAMRARRKIGVGRGSTTSGIYVKARKMKGSDSQLWDFVSGGIGREKATFLFLRRYGRRLWLSFFSFSFRLTLSLFSYCTGLLFFSLHSTGKGLRREGVFYHYSLIVARGATSRQHSMDSGLYFFPFFASPKYCNYFPGWRYQGWRHGRSLLYDLQKCQGGATKR
jgi:hypothetical protein